MSLAQSQTLCQKNDRDLSEPFFYGQYGS